MFYKLIKKIGKKIPGRIGEELVGFSLRHGNVRKFVKNNILTSIRHQNILFNKKQLNILVIGTESCSKFDAINIGNIGDKVYTIDINKKNSVYGFNPTNKKYGYHVVGSALELDRYFEPNYFDIILLNGVFGWGINSIEDQRKTIEVIYKVSKKDSKLLIGWNVNKSIDPVLSKLTNNLFEHEHWAGLSKRIVMNNTTHVFDFFVKIE